MGIPVERDCEEAARIIEIYRNALTTIRKASLTLRGEKSYREFATFASRQCGSALGASK